jgi:hypothetical protein
MGWDVTVNHRESTDKTELQEIMEDTAQKSCWGLTAKAVVGFAGIILLVWLVGGSESAAVLATAG